MITTLTKIGQFQINRGQRLLLYGATCLWFMAMVLAEQRNYQDSWILEDIFWPFVILIALFLWNLSVEDDNRIVALLCAWTLSIVNLVPALKYQQPYGTTVDSTIHYSMTQSLAETGRVVADHTYAFIPGMHAWLASLALTTGVPAADAIKFGLPLTGGIMPLLVYWMCHRVQMPTGLAKYTIGLTCLTTYSYFEPNGTGFTLVPLVMLLGVLVLRAYYTPSTSGKFKYTLIALIGLTQLTIWHSTTPMVLPLILATASLTPVAVWLTRFSARNFKLTSFFLGMALLAGVFFLGYRIIQGDPVFEKVASILYELATAEEAPPSVVPQRVFQITLFDIARVFLLMYGREALMVGLTGLGILAIWKNRVEWEPLLHFYAYLLVIFGVFGVLFLVGYQRFRLPSLAVSPFIAGPGLWWLSRRVLFRLLRNRQLVTLIWSGLIVLLVGFTVVQFFKYQPLVPKAKSISPGFPDEYLVWLHNTNTAYQQRALYFAETRTDPHARFAIDYRGRQQFRRYFGGQATRRRRLDLPLHWNEPVDATKIELFLLHWSGPAGGFSEKVEFRSGVKINELRNTPGWGLIYDNGESFILNIRSNLVDYEEQEEVLRSKNDN